VVDISRTDPVRHLDRHAEVKRNVPSDQLSAWCTRRHVDQAAVGVRAGRDHPALAEEQLAALGWLVARQAQQPGLALHVEEHQQRRQPDLVQPP
jgi:predicted DNA-binding ArsR family transcriptional regulator